ncbi:MAG: substrate-binding domain-containing protein [Pirellulales bacterium]|jgi:LacI family transcriptional regulator|nr:substrate-binding domain-containing protein [Thermoguttaceae bacterium]MDD4786853.1 substrate-binding domain-containing protein [Pirellulales bacterium]MDI9442905.1 substrate-binding domain-containing protein [Planctomycetota bacterium]NLY99915.1 substrate-binding domain-containing protein [Pirellulaceae bacterium]
MAKTRKQVAILLNLNCGFHRQIARGIAKYAGPHDTWLLSVAEHSAETVAALIDWPGDGLIIDLDVRQVDQAVSLFQGEVVGVGTVAPRVLKRLNISTVRTDDRTIAEWAADHLLEQGLEQFAYCGVSRPGRDHWATARRSAFCRRIAEHGRPCAIFAARYDAAQSWRDPQSRLPQWLGRLPKPVGILACNDLQGRCVLEACRRLDLRVPDEVAVIGVDNDLLICALAMPPLTSVATGAEQIGYRAAALLDQRMAGRLAGPQHLVVPPTCLVPRQSTDIAAIRDPIVSSAIRFIREHAAEEIGVADIARHANVSQSTLETHFKHQLGRTVHAEVERVRLETARRLLTTTRLPLEAIARQAGYSSAQYLSAVFRRRLGHAPGQLRNPPRQ